MTQPQEKSWWRRHWPWAIVGCFGGLIAIALVLGGAIVGIAALVMGALKTTGAYREAWAEVRRSEQVAAALGRPLRAGWLVSGQVKAHDGEGRALLQFKVRGPKGKGQVTARAVKESGLWRLEFLAVRITHTGESIILVGSQAEQLITSAPIPPSIQPASRVKGI